MREVSWGVAADVCKRQVVGRRIGAMDVKLGSDTGWESKNIRSRNESGNKTYQNNARQSNYRC